MSREYLIEILRRQRQQRNRQKTMALPSRRYEPLGRRRLNNPAITFYDLASINTGTAESPVYEDHPILKVPGCSITPALDDLGGFIGAVYTVDAWANGDYADYYDRLFAVPVTEWRHHYRKLAQEFAPDGSAAISTGTYPFNLLVRNDAFPNAFGPLPPDTARVFIDLAVGNLSTPEGKAARAASLEAVDMAWDTRGLEYRNMPDLRFRPDPNTFGNYQANREWFSLSTTIKGTFGYKVTAANDPDAADVGDLTISGSVDVYMIPHVGLFAAASYKGTEDVPDGFPYDGDNGMQVLGPWYQVMPRENWPVYVDPYELLDQELLKESYLEYQKGRTDAIASEWFHATGTSLTSAAIDPATFRTGNNSWKSFIDNTGTSVPAYRTGDAGFYRALSPFTATDNVLMAVFKMHDRFYYVWSAPFDSTSNTATDESSGAYGYTLSVRPDGAEEP